jgi:glycosyltransferase involved in cell wall biosynthesis
MSRLLLVVQRYGEEVVGGSEAHARAAAQRLAERHDVEVATTDALDYWTWAPHFPLGVAQDGAVTVRRFPVRAPRDPHFKEFEERVLLGRHTLQDELEWLTRQGPDCPQLLEFLHDVARSGEYDRVIFYTYIYLPTAQGLPIVPERAVLIPTAHRERALHLAPYRALFHLPRAIGYLTPEERDLVHEVLHNESVPSTVLGFALDAPPPSDAVAFRERHALHGPMVLYLGQVSEGKGINELLRCWDAYRAGDGVADATLVLAGTVRMELPERPDVRVLGPVSDEDKWAALTAADVLVQPSHLESLGISLLEAWQAETPALVPEWNAVTAGQVRRSGGGETYGSDADFTVKLAGLLLGTDHGARGKRWVERECSWPAFDERLEELLELAGVA